MIRRNAVVFVFLFVFLGLLAILFFVPESKTPLLVEDSVIELPPAVIFHGRLSPLSISDIYVVENSAERDVESLLKYLQGRSSSLHYLFEKTYSKRKRLKEDLLIGLWIQIDSDGFFRNVKVRFSNAEKSALEKPLIQFVEKDWRYKKVEEGSTTLLIPFLWRAEYSRSVLRDAPLE